MKGFTVKGCTIKQLPDDLLIPAAAAAIQENPANAPLRAFSASVPPLKPEHIAILTSKFWGSRGVDLTFTFLDSADQATVDLFTAHANAWRTEGKANVNFRWTAGNDADVRIARARDGYWSYLGTDIKSIARGEPTMNLEGFTSKTPVSEWKRVVRHEVGHTLGCPHEHSRPAIVNRLDPTKTISYFKRTQGWSEAMIREQILTALSEASLMGSAPEEGSIMCYDFPAACTKNGKAVLGGSDLTATDKTFMASQYPLAVTPPPPVDPPKGKAILMMTEADGRQRRFEEVV